MKMTVDAEPRELVLRDFEAHAASGRAQIEEMRQGTATYKGVPIKFGYLPIGANETTRFLNGVLDFALEQGAEIDEKKARSFIEEEEKAYYEELDNLATFLLEFRYGLPNYVHILHDAGYVTGLTRFLLHETGVVPKEQFIVDNVPKKYQEQIEADIKAAFDKASVAAQEKANTMNLKWTGFKTVVKYSNVSNQREPVEWINYVFK